ncbi:YibE/F family protein [Desulfovibrio sulfodismutans]|uniref:YibE/F family protein n=1 Tax=Desulfolutivibrio sulfodismutans TaxID=63561 RepID=A0A7K3NIL3_9BACT|nr:YibE/F family protein [Desulfolutivibrio sulfodismutans]NDY56000.1 YibE/F family protein [Desulfolutivibrio sulfodismutans]QLA13239.1 YibE/F family protein [Desulfolutivibrio sulfodismutans DSM 3696]
MIPVESKTRRDALLSLLFLILTVGLAFLPTGYESHVDGNAVQCKGRVVSVSDADVLQFGLVRTGIQSVELEILDGPHAGQTVRGLNQLLGKMEMDKIFVPGDTALVVLTRNAAGEVTHVNPVDHYRLGLELVLFGLFAALLLVFGGWTGAKALLSFAFSALAIWKILIPAFLDAYDPILVSLAVVTGMMACVIFLVGGLNKKGVAAFLGSMLGVGTACVLALIFTDLFRLHGAIKPFAESLLYTGYGHLDLKRIFVAAVFIGSCGAMMDLAMDVAASIEEVARSMPGASRRQLLGAGLRVGRAVVGTMTTTLLFAYSGGYIALLMMFMAQGVPLSNLFNLIYVAAEVLNTLVGSFGLVAVAPFTALVGAFLFGAPRLAARKTERAPA